ncbi:transposase [Pseudoduganella lurida]|uniref:transposase n=1 Tax=Pseudoduganella lurida TaxID=1036180 RepID=UPI00119CC4B0|nr:transposase [Pseudoduganella lurida]
MSRPTRHPFHGAVYHVTARGNRRANMFVDAYDHSIWLRIFEETVDQFHLLVYGLCLMPNHFHLLVETPDANLSAAMHYLNGKYAKKFNWRHSLSGHLLQDRFHAVHVDKQEYLLELLRYIVLNPVRAELTHHADHWRWSSHRYHCRLAPCPAWLASDWVIDQFPGPTRAARIHAYRKFVDAGHVRHVRTSGQIDEALAFAGDADIPMLAIIQSSHPHRDMAIRAAWQCGAYTREQIARHFALSVRTVSRVINAEASAESVSRSQAPGHVSAAGRGR